VLALGPTVTTIGRGADNDLVLTGTYVSTHHAAVRWDGTAYVLSDCDSTNGTFLNDVRLSTPRALQNGDRIGLPGDPGVTLVFDATSSTTPMPTTHAPAAAAGTRLDPATAEVWVRGERVHVTAKEYRVLVLLFARAGGLVTKEELAMGVWPEYGGQVADTNVEQLITRLRRKLDTDARQPPMLVTVRGLGYRLVLP
jgi:hypothetical protein